MTSELNSKLATEACRIEEDALYSAKGHFNAGARWARYHTLLGLPAAVIAAIAGGAALKQFPDLAGALALLAASLTTTLTFLKPSERSELHRAAGGQFHALRNQARIFREITLIDGGTTSDEAKARLHELADLRDELNRNAPGIPRGDYVLAKRDIESGHAVHQADKRKK